MGRQVLLGDFPRPDEPDRSGRIFIGDGVDEKDKVRAESPDFSGRALRNLRPADDFHGRPRGRLGPEAAPAAGQRGGDERARPVVPAFRVSDAQDDGAGAFVAALDFVNSRNVTPGAPRPSVGPRGPAWAPS